MGIDTVDNKEVVLKFIKGTTDLKEYEKLKINARDEVSIHQKICQNVQNG